ncbi:MAG: hypothetical protein MI923_27905 [Phycisphaerales bacterium]|nr:hypothetical protein [Phycisphaerales bacterium]
MASRQNLRRDFIAILRWLTDLCGGYFRQGPEKPMKGGEGDVCGVYGAIGRCGVERESICFLVRGTDHFAEIRDS